MANIPFIKMHGIGNDFVIIDNRSGEYTLSTKKVTAIANRKTGIGCDQLVLMENAENADVAVTFYNPDGSQSDACGNATRCVARLLMQENNAKKVSVSTKAGVLGCEAVGDLVRVNMAKPKLDWNDIPLAKEHDTLDLAIGHGELKDPVAVNMGNPHAVFFVVDVNNIDLDNLGPELENHKMFPERANINVAEIINDEEIKLRVWERGTGETLACGSGACATLVAAVRKGLVDHKAVIHLKGGDLTVEWKVGKDVFMTGPTATVFTGEYNDG